MLNYQRVELIFLASSGNFLRLKTALTLGFYGPSSCFQPFPPDKRPPAISSPRESLEQPCPGAHERLNGSTHGRNICQLDGGNSTINGDLMVNNGDFNGMIWDLPSGHLLHDYGKSP